MGAIKVITASQMALQRAPTKAETFSSNARSLLSGTADRMAHLWNMAILQNGEAKTDGSQHCHANGG